MCCTELCSGVMLVLKWIKEHCKYRSVNCKMRVKVQLQWISDSLEVTQLSVIGVLRKLEENMRASVWTLSWTPLVACCKLASNSHLAVLRWQHQAPMARQIAWASGQQCVNESYTFSLGFSCRERTWQCSSQGICREESDRQKISKQFKVYQPAF